MDLNAFEPGSRGRLVEIAGTDPRDGRGYNHKAYVPDPLPEDLSFQRDTTNALGDTMLELGRLDQATEWLPDATLLARPAIRREAVSTSALEGTYAAFEDVLAADVREEGLLSPEVREVLNYVRAAETAFDWIRDRKVTVGFLSALQRTLVAGTESDGRDTGALRSTQVLIGPKGCTVGTARFVPPPPGDLLVAGVRAWETWLERRDDYPVVAKIALAHYQFEALHPFTDGNGRLGRLVVMLQLIGRGVLHQPMLNISPTLYERREEYQSHLLRVSRTGDLDTWVQFFCDVLRTEARSAVERVRRLMAYRDEMLADLKRQRIRGVALDIAHGLLSQPVVSPRWAQGEHEVSYAAANTAIRKLESAGVLREMTGRNYGRLFGATEILAIIRT
jgi:Fic family protein